MRRKAEEEIASGDNGDDGNAARRRLGAEIGSEFVASDTSVLLTGPLMDARGPVLVVEESGDESPQLPSVRPQGTIGIEDMQLGIAEGTGEPLGDPDRVRLVPLLRDNQRRCDYGCERSDVGDGDLGGHLA